MIQLERLGTRPHGDAFTFIYKPERACLRRTRTSRIGASRAHQRSGSVTDTASEGDLTGSTAWMAPGRHVFSPRRTLAEYT